MVKKAVLRSTRECRAGNSQPKTGSSTKARASDRASTGTSATVARRATGRRLSDTVAPRVPRGGYTVVMGNIPDWSKASRRDGEEEHVNVHETGLPGPGFRGSPGQRVAACAGHGAALRGRPAGDRGHRLPGALVPADPRPDAPPRASAAPVPGAGRARPALRPRRGDPHRVPRAPRRPQRDRAPAPASASGAAGALT